MAAAPLPPRKPGERRRTPNPNNGTPAPGKDPWEEEENRTGRMPHIGGPNGSPRPRAAQPGPGAPGSGAGKDSDGGKGRTSFENQRRRQNQGGSDRPGIYKPKDDGQRGGYKDRTTTGVSISGGRPSATAKPTRTLKKRVVVSKNAKAAAKKKLGMK